MNTEYLRQFAVLAAVGHYGKAAEALGISQPGLSHAMQTLERELGVPLFEKSGRRMVLSPYGEQLKEDVQSLVRGLDALTHKASRLRAIGQPVRIASVSPLAAGLVPTLLTGCGDLPPLTLYHGMTGDILKGLEEGRYEIGFCSEPTGRAFEAHPVYDLSLAAVVPLGHPLADCAQVTLAQTAPYPHILFSQTSVMRQVQDRIFREDGITVSTACEAEEEEVILSLVAHGFGIAVLPYIPILGREGIQVIPLAGTSWRSTFFIVRLRAGTHSAWEERFFAHCRDWYRQTRQVLENP